MSSDNEPAWRICRKAVWMYIQNFNNSADAKNLLNQQEDHDLHIASGKCFILLMVNIYFISKKIFIIQVILVKIYFIKTIITLGF